MYHKLQGIVLHHIKYKDNSVIIYMYTNLLGRQTYISKGIHKKSRSFLQTLSIVDFEVQIKPKMGMPLLKDCTRPALQSNLLSDVCKSAISLFVGELLYKLLREEEANPDLFLFLQQSIYYLDTMEKGTANFHLYFMVRLARYLGYSIPDNRHHYTYFDIKSGQFVPDRPLHLQYFNKDESNLLSQLACCSISHIETMELNRGLRSDFTSKMIDFYNFHFNHLLPIQSLSVLQELFS